MSESTTPVVVRLEEAVGRIVRCKDGSERKVISVDPKFVTYSLQISETHWMAVSPTARGYIEDEFIGAPIIG